MARTLQGAPTAAADQAYVALLRAVNVGGRNKLPMKDLAAFFEEGGARDVATYIQSGNVVFQATANVARKLPGSVSARIEERFGLDVPVVLRSVAQFEAVVRGNPFVARGAPAENLHLLFLADVPDPARVARLDARRSPPDVFEIAGREVYLSLPNGMGRTKLGNDYFERVLGVVSTGRNWRTVLELLRRTQLLG